MFAGVWPFTSPNPPETAQFAPKKSLTALPLTVSFGDMESIFAQANEHGRRRARRER